MKEIQINHTDRLALIDDCDYEEITKWKWKLVGEYIEHIVDRRKKKNGKKIGFKKRYFIHRYIWELHNGTSPDGYIIDHIDRNPFNNQLSNLRLATPSQNNLNKSRQANIDSGFIGVSRYEDTHTWKDGTITIKKYWLASVPLKGKCYKKYFEYTDEGKVLAAKWYDMKRKELCGEFHGQLNFD